MIDATLRISNKNYEIFGSCIKDISIYLVFTRPNGTKARIQERSSLFIVQHEQRLTEALKAAKHSYRAA